MNTRKMRTQFKSSLLALLLLVSTSTFAQQAGSEQRAKELTDKMKTELSLNEEQYQKIYTINLDFAGKAQGIKQEDGNKMSKFKKLKALDKERDESLKSILSDGQFKTFETNKKENRQEMKSRFKNH